MKNLPVLLALSASLLASACAPAPQSPPAPTPTADPVAPSEAPSLSANEPIAGAAYVASPNAGPALDEYPPAPVRAVASSPIDLRSLTEPPLLVVDALGHTSKIKSLDYTSDGRLLVSAGYDKTIRVWSATTGELVRTIRGDIGEGPAGRIYATALSARDELLAVGGWLGKSAQPSAGASDAAYQIRIVDFYSGTTLRLLSGHSDVVTSLAFSHTGARLVSGGGDGQARIWDARKQGSELTLSGHSGIVSAVAWSNDDRLVATAGNDRQVRIWDATNGALISTRSGHEGTVTALGFTPDGRRLLSAGADRTLRSWELLGSQTGGTLARLASGIGSLAISADGQSVVVTPTEAPFESRVLKVADGRVAARFAGQDNVVLASAISPNGKWVATAGGGDHGLAIWNIQTGRSELSTRGHGSAVWSVAFGSDGRSFSFGHRYAPPAGAPYEINGPLEERFVFEPGRLELDVVPDGAYVGDARAREAAGDLVLRTPSGHEDAMLEIWERGSRKAAIGRDSTSGYSHLSFTLSETADLVVSGGENGTLASYDAKTGAKRRDFTGHTGDVLAVALSRDGRRLVSGSSDQTVRLWDVATGRPLLTLFHARNHEWVAFTGAGYFASSAYGEGYLGWHVNRGADRTAAFFSATGLEQQLRFDAVVFEYLINSGDVREAVRRANLLRPAGLAAIPFYRFEDLPQFAPPEIYHMNPGLDLEVNKDRILLEAEAASPSAEPVTAIEILVNGRPLDERWLAHAGQPQIEIQGRYAKIRATLPLPEPNNRISVVARSRFSEGPPAYLNVKRKGGPGELERLYRPNLLVLSVGISKYRGTELQSGSYAERDATALADAFKAQNKNLYGQVKTRVLKDAAASRTAINEGLAWVAQEAKQGDVVIVYLSGHAARDVSGEYHFLPEDGDRQQLSATALSWTALKKALDASPAKVIVLADTCHAGAVGGAAPVDLSWALRENEASDGTIVFTAAAGSEMSYQNEKWGHGAFASALLDGLSGRADYDGDKKVFVRELQYFVGARVAELTAGKQHPTLHLPSSVPNFALAELRATQTSSPKAKP